MSDIGYLGLIIIIANVVASYKGFKDYAFLESWLFRIDPVLVGKDYKRLISSGFVHVNWTHLIFNMISLFAFAGALESTVGEVNFLLIYFGSLIGGNLFALYIHRNHGDYSAVGASGAVSGVIFASLVVFPGMEVGMLFIPIGIPGWLFAILFVAVSIRGIRNQRGNIGHDAHLGGGLIGLLITIGLFPTVLETSALIIALVLIPSIIFIYLIVTRPEILILGSINNKPKFFNKEDQYNTLKRDEQVDIDKILDKISAKGINSLTAKEKRILDEHSRKGN